LAAFIGKHSFQNADFGHIIHYGYPEDLYREYNFIEHMSTMRSHQWRQGSFPIVNEIIVRNIPSCNKSTKSEIRGWGIIITNYTQELIEDNKLRKRKIFQAAKLAEKMGAKMVGMGGLVASFAQGGQWLSEQLPGIGFTTGHAYTIANIMEIFSQAAARVQLAIPKTTVAIVGAAGSIGSGCAKLIGEYNPRKLILIDLNNFNISARLNEIASYVRRVNKRTDIKISTKISDISMADVIIVATNSTTSVIKNKYLKPGAIIIDDSFPKNVSRKTMERNKDILLLEGGMIRLPLSVEVLSARNMPDLMDAPLTRLISCKETYGCIAETLTLSIYRHRRNYGLGYADPVLAKQILSRARKVGFSAAPLQCFDESIDEKRFQRIARIVKQHS
jgi:predicted amino acid dehydrogenase